MTHLDVGQIVVLVALIILRQCLQATPLALFIAGLGLRRAVANDVTGYLVGTLAPAPSDMVLRMAMFRAWGVDLTRGSSGLALNALLYYVGRFSAPTAGLLVFLASYGWDGTYFWSALGGLAVVGALVGILLAVSRGRQRAFAVGRRIGRIAARVSRRDIDADNWGKTTARFQEATATQLSERGGLAVATVAAQLALDSALLLLCVRFVGLSSSTLAAPAVIAAFLCVYPLTALPLAGLGFLDTAVIALFDLNGTVDSQNAVAALVIWRVATLLSPLLVGAVTLVWWRRTNQTTASIGSA